MALVAEEGKRAAGKRGEAVQQSSPGGWQTRAAGESHGGSRGGSRSFSVCRRSEVRTGGGQRSGLEIQGFCGRLCRSYSTDRLQSCGKAI